MPKNPDIFYMTFDRPPQTKKFKVSPEYYLAATGKFNKCILRATLAPTGNEEEYVRAIGKVLDKIFNPGCNFTGEWEIKW